MDQVGLYAVVESTPNANGRGWCASPVLRRLDLDQAVMMAQGATRRYAKRQRTWFRHRLPARHIAYEQFSERLNDEIFSIIRQS